MKYGSVNLGIIRYCNCQCNMCSAVDTHDKKKLMSLEDFENILLHLENKKNYLFSAKNLRFTGWGEPLIHKDFFSMVELARTHGWNVAMHSNGLALTEKNCKKLCDSGVQTLNISLTGMSPRVFEKFQGNGFESPGKVLKCIQRNIIRFVRIRDKAGKGPKLRVIFMVCKDSWRELIPYVRFMKKAGVDEIQITELDEHGKKAERGTRIRCRQLYKNELNIDYDGTVLLCCGDFRRNVKLGNILDAEKVNRLTKEFRRKNRHGKMECLPQICQTCETVSAGNFGSFMRNNSDFILDLKQQKYLMNGFKDYILYCDSQRKLYEELKVPDEAKNFII